MTIFGRMHRRPSPVDSSLAGTEPAAVWLAAAIGRTSQMLARVALRIAPQTGATPR